MAPVGTWGTLPRAAPHGDCAHLCPPPTTEPKIRLRRRTLPRSTSHLSCLKPQVPGRGRRALFRHRRSGGQRKQECPASSCVSLPRNAGEGRGTLLPPLPAPLGAQPGCRGAGAARKRRDERWGGGRRADAAVPPRAAGAGSGWAGDGGGTRGDNTAGVTQRCQALPRLERSVLSKSCRANITPLSLGGKEEHPLKERRGAHEIWGVRREGDREG